MLVDPLLEKTRREDAAGRVAQYAFAMEMTQQLADKNLGKAAATMFISALGILCIENRAPEVFTPPPPVAPKTLLLGVLILGQGALIGINSDEALKRWASLYGNAMLATSEVIMNVLHIPIPTGPNYQRN